MNIMVGNVFGFQKEPLLTLKDPTRFGYLRLEIFSTRLEEKEKEMVLGQWLFKAYD